MRSWPPQFTLRTRVRPPFITAFVVVALVIASSLSASTQSTSAAYQVPSTIAKDCSSDVTDPLLSWIASVPNGSTLTFSSDACYRIEGTLEIRERSGLTFEGNGATFRSLNPPTDQRAIWRVIDSSDFIFRNMTIDGSFTQNESTPTHDASLQHAHAIDLRGTSAEIDHVTATDLAGDCVYFGLGYSSALLRSSGSYHDSTCSRISRNAVSITAGDDIRVERITTSGIGFITFDVEPNVGTGWGSDRAAFDSNTIGSYYLYAYALIENAPLSTQTFSNNYITASKGLRIGALPFQDFRPSDVKITGNVATNATGSPAMELKNIDGLTVTGNTVPLTSGTMATVDASCVVDISGNKYPGGSSEVSITNSTCSSPAPTVSSFTPTSGPVGTTVTVSGAAFTGATKVAFNGVAATYSVDSDSQITATVPSGATSGKISVVTPAGTGTSSGSFTVSTGSGSGSSTPCATGQYMAQYFAGTAPDGSAALARCENSIDYDWGGGGPGDPIPANNFSARWTGDFQFAGGETTFTATGDDGVRVWVDGSLLIDAWIDQPATTYSATRALSAGTHEVKVLYYEKAGLAVAKLSWTTESASPCSTGQFRAQFYPNQTLDDPVVRTGCVSALDNAWRAGGPGAPLPNDHFSARWTGQFDFPAGETTFTATSDDGIRVWVDGSILIDAWIDQPATTYTATRTLSAGRHDVKVEYYENAGQAVAKLGWATAPASDASSTSACPSGQYLAQYFSNLTLGGSPALARCEGAVNDDWGSSGPGSPVPSDNFSARWTGTFEFAGGDTAFTATADDGLRVWVDGSLFIDAWTDHPATTYSATRTLSEGTHQVRVEYYERAGDAVAELVWASVSSLSTSSPSPSSPSPTSPSSTPSCEAGQYLTQYFGNVTLGGSAVLSRCEQAVDENWGAGGPGAPVPSDDFSARWAGDFNFDGGSTSFTATADDGLRVWVDGSLVIDAWSDQPATTYAATRTLSKGLHSVRVEYYEKAGLAVAKVSWTT